MCFLLGEGVRCGVWIVGCRVLGVGCWVLGVGCGVWGVGCGVWGVGCGVWVVGFGVAPHGVNGRESQHHLRHVEARHLPPHNHLASVTSASPEQDRE